MKYERFRHKLSQLAYERVNTLANSNMTDGEIALLLGIPAKEIGTLLGSAVAENLLTVDSNNQYQFVGYGAMVAAYERSAGIRWRLYLPTVIVLIVVCIGYLWAHFITTWRTRSAIEAQVETYERNIAVVKECVALYQEYENASPMLKKYALNLLKEKTCPVAPPTSIPVEQ